MTPPTFTVERSTRASRLGAVAGVVLLLALAMLPLWGEPSLMRMLVEFISLLVLAQMWNLLAGYAGLVSIGQQAYIGLGGYALIVLADELGVNPFGAVFVAGVVAAAFSIPTAALVFRFHGGYFAVGTWAVAEVYRLLIANTPPLGRGTGRTLAAVFPVARDTREIVTYELALLIGTGAILYSYLHLRSRFGLALTAIRDSEPASESLGIDVFRTKLAVYVIAAFGTGTTGALIYLNVLRISPDAAFSVNWTAFMIFIVVIGGIGTIEGPVLGTLVFFGLREFLAEFGSWYLILLGLVAMVVMLRHPQGLWSLVAARWDIRFFPVQRRLRLGPVEAHAVPSNVRAPHSEFPRPGGRASSPGGTA
jgi:branched-chain amino acid transport system permease protein